jgi:hypothetical protein
VEVPLKEKNTKSAVILAEWPYKEFNIASGGLLYHKGIMVPGYI